MLKVGSDGLPDTEFRDASIPGFQSPCDFIAAITQHIPDKSFQQVGYYGWYSNKMRGQWIKREAERLRECVGKDSGTSAP